MSTPDDLTEAEAIDLQRLLGEAETNPYDGAPMSIEEYEESMKMPGVQPIPSGTIGRWPGEESTTEFRHEIANPAFDPGSGCGLWNGHEFTLTPEQLKRVHTIFTECIAAKLTAEIERLRNEVQ